MTNKDILTILKEENSSIDYDRYLKQLIYKKTSSDEKIAIFEVPNKFIAMYIKSKYTTVIQNCFEKMENYTPAIEIKVTGERKTKKAILSQNEKEKTTESTILNPSYTFDSFIVGSSNQMAYNASLAVSKKPGIQYNPLFIYGGTGLGKTHLLQSIGNSAIEEGKTIIYVVLD